MKSLAAVVLAAGEGKRMKTRKPKVLHTACGKPLVQHVADNLKELTTNIILVTGHKGEEVKSYMGGDYTYVYQEEQKGTGHAVLKALPSLPDQGKVIVMCGDTPLISAVSLKRLVRESDKGDAALLTAEVPDAKGYGRIIRDMNHGITGIVEEKEAGREEKKIKEVNTGTYCFKLETLRRHLPRISPRPSNREYYLTDIISLIIEDGGSVIPCLLEDFQESLGINDLSQLSQVEEIMRRNINRQLMLSGVRLVDPQTTYIDDGVTIGSDTVIYPQTIIEGGSRVGDKCLVGPSTHLIDVCLEDEVQIRQSVAKNTVVPQRSIVGPYAYLQEGFHKA